MRVINIVDNATTVNMGIWNAAVATASALKRAGISSELWFPAINDFTSPIDTISVPLKASSKSELKKLISERKLDPEQDIIVTHGCWRFPTRWGYWLKKKNFCWVYTPHGMLEPWGMQQKKWKKKLFFSLFEEPMASQASCIRAVSGIERENLIRLFPASKITWIANGVDLAEQTGDTKIIGPRKFLFLSRLHPKKGVVPLIKAWINSGLNNNRQYSLTIAGPDQGELPAIQELMQKSSNIFYPGAVYGDEKEKLLQECHVFVLPSMSEGFPTALLEAMSYGLVPMYTDGCNFQEGIDAGVAIKITASEAQIITALNLFITYNDEFLESMGLRARTFVGENYSLDKVAEKQIALYYDLLKNNKHAANA